MLEQLGLIGTIRDEDDSPEEPDTESDPEVSLSGSTAERLRGETTRAVGCRGAPSSDRAS